MPEVSIPWLELSEYVTEDELTAGFPADSSRRAGPLKPPALDRLGPILEPRGFNLAEEIWVTKVIDADVYKFEQPRPKVFASLL